MKPVRAKSALVPVVMVEAEAGVAAEAGAAIKATVTNLLTCLRQAAGP